MFKNCITLFLLGFAFLLGCKPEKNKIENEEISDNQWTVENRFSNLLMYPVDSMSFPRSMEIESGEVRKVPSSDWTSGFFPGNLWQIYRLTGKDQFKSKAADWTALMEKEKLNAGTHDMGFKIYCSFGEGLKVEDNQHYRDVIISSAKTLTTRFNEKVGSLRSWDFNKDVWSFPVIIDNMLNLELLFEATKISGDSTFHKIAISHANTTLKNHIRSDNSIFHVVDYNPLSGEVNLKTTHQGFNDYSSWSRGQGWGIYGFTMVYRYTKDPKYLTQAEATLNYFMNHPNLPEDKIPYWDFSDPAIPNSPRDASAAAITASACLELYSFTKNNIYLDFANKILASLNSSEYLLNEKVKGPFILNHSTGNWPKNDEINGPIVYADYYFLEALLRKRAL